MTSGTSYSRVWPKARRAALAAVLLATPLAAPAPALAQARQGPKTVAPVAEKLLDAVVNISTSQTLKSSRGVPLPKVPKGSPFEDLFEDFFSGRNGQQPSDKKVASLGSGFVIDGKAGLIVTNHHVIEGADEITINFADGSKLKVDKVIGKDTKTDLALLKVTPRKPLKQAAFGSSANMKVGDWVMAIGNPFGLGGSVTVGIISAKQRDINSGPYDDYLQTDAAINKGNSGGPLFNMDGEVIGVNTAIISPSGGSIGIGFAVPSDTAMLIIEQLRQFGETRRGWLGVNVQSVTDDIAESLGTAENAGALISNVTPDGPAAKAGIKPGDVVVRFDGKPVPNMRALPRLVTQTPVGRTVDVEVIRNRQSSIIKVVIGRLEEKDAKDDGKKPAETPAKPGKASQDQIPGLRISPITDELRAKYKIGARTSGIVIVEIDAASRAGKKGLKVGEVIVEAAQETVTSLEDLAKSIAKVRNGGRRQLLLRLEDGRGNMRFVAVPI
ncbi:MAG: Do family serine endopeptidase [Hyphomicrobiaceae bacterium]